MEGSQLRLVVSDTGIGIPADRIPHLFLPFTQADASTTRRFGGTGLGLAITRRLVEAMSGTITLSSREGVGSRFTVLLPLQSISTSSTQLPAIRPGHAPDAAAGMHILVVDDNNINIRIAKAMLERLGARVSVAMDGDVAISLHAQGDIDLIFMDIQMPGLDGYETTRRIRATEAGGRRTPIIALTADAGSDERGRSLAAGMDDHLRKPLNSEILAECVTRWRKA
jgi:CheY-like chemotaxis protein